METATTARVLTARRKAGFLGSIGVRFMIDGRGGRAVLAGREHPDVGPRAGRPTAPTHARGRIQLRPREHRRPAGRRRGHRQAGRPDLKPRPVAHLLNAGDESCRILEIISPAGFEQFFAELVDLGGVAQADPQAFDDLRSRYGLEMEPDSIPELIERFGVVFPGEPF